MQDICLYCNNILIDNSCSNHYVRVDFGFDGIYSYTTIWNSDSTYFVDIYWHHIYLYKWDYEVDNYIQILSIPTLPTDPNITPENIDQKIKTYLNFQ
jgi:hypothetical protein